MGLVTKSLTLLGFSTRGVHTNSLASLSAGLSFSFLTSTPIDHTTIGFIVPQFLLLLFPFCLQCLYGWIPLKISLERHLKDVRGQNKSILLRL